jgi:hypothetical protein
LPDDEHTIHRLSGALGTCGWCRSLKLGNPDTIQIIISILRWTFDHVSAHRRMWSLV